jgi:hypothetical protein
MTRRFTCLVLVALTAIAWVHAQRDRTAPQTVADEGVITGQVVTATTPPTPVGRATVTLSGGGIERLTIADDDGRFSFEALPAGRYAVRVRKAAWLEGAYGATRPGGAGTPVALAAGERQHVSIGLARGAVIEGRLTLPNGTPATRTSVRIAPVGSTGSPRGVDPVITDDRGIYRIYGIPPGDYVVQANPPVIPAMMQALYRPATQEIGAALERLTNRGNPGQPGAAAPGAGEPLIPARQIVYAAVFYPGVAARENAVPITVAAGDERLGVDFVFSPTPMSRVVGRLTGPSGSMAGAQVRLQPRGSRATTDARVAPDGTFVVPAVAPGTYDVTAKLDPRRTVPAANEPRVVRMVDPAAAGSVSDDTLWGTAEVQVIGQDIEGLSLALQPGGRMSGRLRFAGSDDTAAPSAAGVRLRLTPVAQPQGPVIGPAGFTTLREIEIPADGRFVVAGLAPGAQQLSVVLPAALTDDGWWARSAIAGDVDLLDAPVNVSPGRDVGDVDLMLSRQRSSLTGRLQLTDGRPGSDYFVIAFSTDSRAWQTLSRRTHATRPADDGVFRIEDMPPGEYFLTVMSDFDSTMLSAPGFFEQAAAAGVRFTLAEGEQREQSFRVGQ